MAMSGTVFAVDPGNAVVGPDVTSGTAHVNILQVGTGNVLSGDGTTGGASFVVNSGTGALDLTIQQVGTEGGSPTGGNTAAVNAYTDNATTKIRVFQGGKATGPGGTSGVASVLDSTDIGVDGTATGNTATITLGSSGTKAGASEILVSQQGDGNIATLALGGTAFTGVMQVMQLGNSNTADVTVSGQSTSKTFNIGQGGNGNTLLLTAVDVGGNVTANFGGPSFASAFTSSKPTAGDTAGGNNASTFNYGDASGGGANPDVRTIFGTGKSEGINLGSISSLNLGATGGGNKVQVDLTSAASGSAIDLAMGGATGGSTLAVYGGTGTQVNLGSNAVGASGQLTLAAGKELVAYAAGSGAAINVQNVTFSDSGYFSTAEGGTINLTNGEVLNGGISVIQSGAAHTFTATNDASSSATWNVSQTGPVASTATVTNNAAGGSYTLTQTSEANGGAHSLTLTDGASTTGGTWTVEQTGAGAKTLTMTNTTTSALINVSQTGALAQSATGITFAAASGSAFNLTQK
jgi:hypothetical protein